MNNDPNLWNQVFNDRNTLLAFLGAMGGMTRALALKTSWVEGLRVTVIGAIFAAGVGTLSPVLLRPWLGEIPDDLVGTFGLVGAAAFIAGLMVVTIIERFIGQPNQSDTGENDET